MSKKQIAIITGASSGFGKEFVKLMLKEKGIREIWSIARNENRLNILKKKYGYKVRPIPMDLTKRENFKKMKELLEESDVSIKYLINNAGFAKFCSYDDISIEESLNMIDLNISAVVAMGLICIPFMEKESHILNISSQASFSPLPYQNIYSSTKAFVRNYTRALNIELRDRNIHAIAICPGWMKTEIYDRGIIGAKKATHKFVGMVTPDVVAKKALDDTKRGKDISVYGIYVKTSHALSKILSQRAMMAIWLKQQEMK